MTAVTVREASLRDASLLAELGRRTFFDTFAADNDADDMSAYLDGAFSISTQNRELAEAGSRFLIAESEGEPLGYARLRQGPAPEEVEGDAPVELVRFYIDKAWIGRGVGGRLMREALQVAERLGHDAMWLSVWERNTRAIGFYERQGFVAAGKLRFLLGEDVQRDVLMVRPIADQRHAETEHGDPLRRRSLKQRAEAADNPE